MPMPPNLFDIIFFFLGSVSLMARLHFMMESFNLFSGIKWKKVRSKDEMLMLIHCLHYCLSMINMQNVWHTLAAWYLPFNTYFFTSHLEFTFINLLTHIFLGWINDFLLWNTWLRLVWCDLMSLNAWRIWTINQLCQSGGCLWFGLPILSIARGKVEIILEQR